LRPGTPKEAQEEQLDLIIRTMCQRHYVRPALARRPRQETMPQIARGHLDRNSVARRKAAHIRPAG
jgi:hypothetical protein